MVLHDFLSSLSLPVAFPLLQRLGHPRENLPPCSRHERVGVKPAILMHLFMGVIKINGSKVPRVEHERDAIIIAIRMKYYHLRGVSLGRWTNEE